MSPWHSKMEAGQNFVKKAVNEFIGCLGWKGRLLCLTSKDGKVTLTFSTPLWHLSAPLKSPPAPRPKALFPGPPASEPSASGPPYRCPTAAGRTSSYWTSCSRISTSWTYSSWTPALQRHQWGPAQQERDWLRANLNLPRNCIAVAVCANYFRTRFQEQHCEYSFN